MVMGWDKGIFREESVVVQYVQTWACIPSMLVLYLARFLKKFEKTFGNLKPDLGSISHQGNPIGHQHGHFYSKVDLLFKYNEMPNS
jgi:hypothetical protein